MSVKTIVKESLKLKPSDRVRLANEILQSIEVENPELDKLWGEASEKRYSSYKEGKTQAITRKELMREHI